MENGAITAYASEEFRVANAQPWIKQKLLETKNLDGVIFFTAYQFLYGKTFNFKLFKYILNDLSLEIHFARENLSFRKNRTKLGRKIVIFNLLQSNFSKRK